MQSIKGHTGDSQSNATPGGERVPALPRHRVSRQIQTSIVVHSGQQSNLSEIPWDPLRQNGDLQTNKINKTSLTEVNEFLAVLYRSQTSAVVDRP